MEHTDAAHRTTVQSHRGSDTRDGESTQCSTGQWSWATGCWPAACSASQAQALSKADQPTLATAHTAAALRDPHLTGQGHQGGP